MGHLRDTERFAPLYDRFGQQAQKLSTIHDHTTEASGSDHTGSVTATLDAQGVIDDLTVAPSWRRRLEPEGLGAAVGEAVNQAMIARLQGWGSTFGHEAQPSAPASRPVPPAAENLAVDLAWMAGPIGRTEGTAALRAMASLLEEAERTLDDASAALADLPSAAHCATAPSGHVTVMISGTGLVQSVRYDGSWLRSADSPEVSTETALALRVAQKTAAEDSPRTRQARDAIEELGSLGQDSVRLARRIGLVR